MSTNGWRKELDSWPTSTTLVIYVNDTNIIPRHSGIHAGIKFRPSAAELATLGPAFGSVWKSVFANAPDKGVFWTGILAAQLGPANPERVEKYFTHAYILVGISSSL